MISRFEYKYLVPIGKLPVLRERLAPYVEIDPNAAKTGKNKYVVRSIYFDSSNLKYYHKKVEGIDIRKKVRIRSYNERQANSQMFLEIKKKYQKKIIKYRSKSLLCDADDLFKNGKMNDKIIRFGNNGDSEKNARLFFFNIFKECLKPVILVKYDREAYFHRFNHLLRFTFDFNLRSRLSANISDLFEEENLLPVLDKFFIFEVKFSSSIPRWLKKVIADYNLIQQAVSKYTICLDSHLGKKFVDPTVEAHFKKRIFMNNFMN